MNIEFIFALIALFIAALAIVIAISASLRVHQLEHEMESLRFSWTQHINSSPDYTDKDIPAFLRRQAD